MHYEVELGLIMGKQVRDLDPEDTKGALDAIDGAYFILYSFFLIEGGRFYTYTLVDFVSMSMFVFLQKNREREEKGEKEKSKGAKRYDTSAFPGTPFTKKKNNKANASATNPGYLLAIDMTARNVQDEAKKKGLPWSIAKGFDTFMPISNIIAKSRIPDPQNAHLWLSVNKEVKQSDNTELMLFRIPRMLSDISRVMSLEKGDIVLTGTPKGVGPVKTGDVMRAGLKVDGKDIEEAGIEVPVTDREGLYEFKET